MSGCQFKPAENSNYCNSHTCKTTDCYEVRVEVGQYCIDHTCEVDGCVEGVSLGSELCAEHKCLIVDCNEAAITDHYCEIHYREYQNSISSAFEQMVNDTLQSVADDLRSFNIVNIEMTGNPVYIETSADLKNKGTKTFKYVKVKATFYDSGGEIVDTDWTYAVGSEGILPGETKHFSLLTDTNTKISSVQLSIQDYQ